MRAAVVGVALAVLAGAPAAMAASSNSNARVGMSFVPFHGFPRFTQRSHVPRFAIIPNAPLGFCCVTAAAPAPQVVIQVVETPPPPVEKPVPPRQASIVTEAGVTVIRGAATH